LIAVSSGWPLRAEDGSRCGAVRGCAAAAQIPATVKAYVEALILATPKDQLVQSVKPKKPKGLSAKNLAKMEQEMAMHSAAFRSLTCSPAHSP
jgi:hypothetical protein